MQSRRKKLFILPLVLTLTLSGCSLGTRGVASVDKFTYPDIKKDFCGVKIDFRYCKCAFHKEYCDEIKLSKSAANSEVNRQYDEWVNKQLASFGALCSEKGGIFNKGKGTCTYCKEGYKAKDGSCQEVKDGESSQQDGQQTAAIDEGLFDAECKARPDVFDNDWKKYSDIDSRLTYDERSYEAKQVLDLDEQMVSLMVEGFALERDQEVDKLTREELGRYREALTKNIKTNLLKSFWRLAWITYSTIDSGKGLGESYSELLSGVDTAVEGVGKGLKVIQGVVPNDSVLAIDTSTFSGKVKSVGVNAALEAAASLGDPVSTATEFFNSSANVNFPSADITEEEVAILRDQHLKKGAIDTALKESLAHDATRQSRMAEIEKKIEELKGQISAWEGKEKDRVRSALEESCRNLKKKN